jgi:uncharacterized membrane protein (UPF0127 family)
VRKPRINPNYLAPAIILVVAAVVLVVVLVVGESKPKVAVKPKLQADTACGPYRQDGSVIINGQKINVEIPKNSDEFEKGLAGRPCILPNQGMFFAFKKDGQYPFWMKGMKFPIDIVWITSTHRVAAQEINESPKTYPDKFVNKIPAQYVLELKANRSKELRMEIGSTVQFSNT